jgi:hypothetical protein
MQASRKANNRLVQLGPVPPALRPLVRAYVLGYGSAVLPRLVTLLLQRFTQWRRRHHHKNTSTAERDDRSFAEAVLHILGTGLELHRFPAFCAALIGGTTLLEEPAKRVVNAVLKGLSYSARVR